MNIFYLVNYDLYKYEMRIKLFIVVKLWFFCFCCLNVVIKYFIVSCMFMVFFVWIIKGFFEVLIFIKNKNKNMSDIWYGI